MTTDALWRIATRLLHPAQTASLHLELMSNEDLDRWLEERHST
jgi:hypothetical protein